MEGQTKKICRLCFKTIRANKCDAIDGALKEMLKVVLIDLNLSFSANPIICKKCLECLQKSFSFKTTCLKTEDSIRSFASSHDSTKIDLNEILPKDIPTETADVTERQKICRFCLQVNAKPYTKLNIFEDIGLTQMVKKCVPEMNFDLTDDPSICHSCLENLMYEYSFIWTCLESEEKIKNYLGAIGIGNECVDLASVSRFCTNIKIEDEECDKNVDMADPKQSRTEVELRDDIQSKFAGIENDHDVKILSLPHISEIVFEDQEASNEKYPESTTLAADPLSENSETNQFFKASSHYLEPLLQTLRTPGDASQRHGRTSPNPKMPSTRPLTCSECNYIASNSNDLKYHFLKHKGKIKMRHCESCPFITRHKNVMDNHRVIHLNEDEIEWQECKFCTFKTKLKCNLEKHQLTHQMTEDMKRFKCDECPYKTMWKRDLERHVIKHGKPDQVVLHHCHLCAFATKHQRYLKFHIQKVHVGEETSDKTFGCAQCNFTTKSKRNLVPHMVLHKNPAEWEIYRCKMCPYQAKWKESVKKHEKIHMQVYKCDQCDFETRLKRFLKEHILGHKSLEDLPTYTCEHCSFTSKWKHSIQKHDLVHKGPEEVQMYECPHCKYKTKRQPDLKHHIRTIHEEIVTLYSCDQCLYKTQYRNNFKNHVKRLHSNTDDMVEYHCVMCSFKTKYKGSLESHELSYHRVLDEKSMLKCALCNYKAKRRDCLAKHMFSHQKVAEADLFRCGHAKCKYKTKYKRALIRHVSRHMYRPEKKVPVLECTSCDYTTKYKSCLTRHAAKHVEVVLPMFKCTRCDYTTKYKSCLTRHASKHFEEVKVEPYDSMSISIDSIKCE